MVVTCIEKKDKSEGNYSMYRKFSQGWFKHFDFIVIDLLCVQFSFFAAAFWRHGGFPYHDKIYVNTAILLFD